MSVAVAVGKTGGPADTWHASPSETSPVVDNALLGALQSVVTTIGSIDPASIELASSANQIAVELAEMTAESHQVAAATEELTATMQTIASSAEEMAATTKSVAAAAEEMTTAIGEVATSAERSATETRKAAELATESSAAASELGEAADSIGRVLKVIEDIAGQTKLLALNATLEAARAGEAGRGFAVVANEVKELARQTAEAAGGVRNQIAGMQDRTHGIVDAITKICESTDSASQLSQIIATAVEEQRATTAEIARNIAEAAVASSSVSESVTHCAAACQEISQSLQGINSSLEKANHGAARSQEAGTGLLADVAKLHATRKEFPLPPKAFDATGIRSAHGQWRVKLAEMLAGKRELPASELSDHTQCAFGKWYTSEGTQRFGHLPVFQQIDAQHAAVHALARKVVDLFHGGDKRAAALELDGFPQLSAALFASLDELERLAELEP
ncbi:MAG: hypothetical protein CMJ58_23895 [Planctomycetaceae bacterium]|nr:hypothetical protein [Planctomycetaceae bacterium]